MARDYDISEQDIEATIRYLKTVDAESATPEMAIAFLEELRAGVHTLAHSKPELLEKILLDIKDKMRADKSIK